MGRIPSSEARGKGMGCRTVEKGTSECEHREVCSVSDLWDPQTGSGVGRLATQLYTTTILREDHSQVSIRLSELSLSHIYTRGRLGGLSCPGRPNKLVAEPGYESLLL